MKLLDDVKQFLDKIPGSVKKIAGIVTAVAVVATVALMFLSNNKNYQSLFTGLSDVEASEIMGKLQALEVSYQYQDGNIKVDERQVNQIKATLVSEGYPKSGFTYDVFKDGSNLMTTDYEKRKYDLFQLQDRMAATIKVFDGVENAYVTIALGEEQKYALSQSDLEQASASVVVEMKNGGSPTPSQVKGIQNLVAKGIPKMTIEHVGVFDGNGNDVSIKGDDQDSATLSQKRAALEQETETNIESNVLKQLIPLYGPNNVRVSVKCKINMEKKITERIDYVAPNEEAKSGIVSKQQLEAQADSYEGTASGVPGVEGNADIDQYATETGEGGGFFSRSSDTDYLVNQVKEQGQDNGGTIEDLTVSVVINGSDLGETTVDQLRSLVGNAAGMSSEVQQDKISILNAPFYQADAPVEEVGGEVTQKVNLLPFIIGGAALVLLIIIIATALILGRKKKKKKARLIAENQLEQLQMRLGSDGAGGGKASGTDDFTQAQDDKSAELVTNIKEFADQNPEISAQLLKSWLRGGEDGGN